MLVHLPNLVCPRAVLNGKKKVFRYTVFPKMPVGTQCVQPWLAAVGGWRLATGGLWRLVVGDWWRLAVVGGWRLVAAGGWRWLAVVGGSWRLAVGGPLGRSSRAVLNKKKTWLLKDRPLESMGAYTHRYTHLCMCVPTSCF